jgi:hypothetical protein
MCPFCLATAAVIVGSATGTGGLTAFVATTIFKRKKREKFPNRIEEKEVEDGNNNHRGKASKGSLAR